MTIERCVTEEKQATSFEIPLDGVFHKGWLYFHSEIYRKKNPSKL